MKLYAVINLKNLRVVAFDSEGEWSDAINALHNRGIGFVPLKFSKELGAYYLAEVIV